ncbi:MAG: hypothetical protein MUD01_22905 [Chloroflexaceae bacterium]|jgi:hypothetical protein|nr:hypothetical protein [Chloroflexaceae bacterium]
MINLLYHSHTVVPAHLEELVRLGVLDADEQVLVALDGVVQDGNGRRLSGPTLHDYCLLTSLRVLLWARDYGRHLCYAFPLTELALVEGLGTDPLHAQLQLTFLGADGEEQRFTLALLPQRDLEAAVTLLHLAGEAAQEYAAQGMHAHQAGPEIAAALAAQIYGTVEGALPGDQPYRWPGATRGVAEGAEPAFQQEQAGLPPEQIYAAGRLVRSAWDTLRRTVREADLPFDLNGGSLRDLTETVRAINDLVTTVSSNPTAREMAMAFLNRRGGQTGDGRRETGDGRPGPEPGTTSAVASHAGESGDAQYLSSLLTQPGTAAPPATPAAPVYREIPLRRRSEADRAAAAVAPIAPAPQPATPPAPVRGEPNEIPLRRRMPINPLSGNSRPPLVMSGSGDANKQE